MDANEERETTAHLFKASPKSIDNCLRPEGLLPYWGWLLGKTHTEPVEFFLSLLSAWYVIIVFGVSQIPTEKWGALIIAMDNIIPIFWWAVLLLVGAVSKIIGLAFRLWPLRLIGLAISVMFWLTLASVTWVLQPFSPSWGGYAIIGLTAAWGFVRVVWGVSDPVAMWLRRLMEGKGHAWRDRRE